MNAEFNYYPLNIQPLEGTTTGSNIISAGMGSVMAAGFLQSPNYVTGSSGWKIDADGNVEFDDGKFRGNITGATGTFSGTITAAAGTIGGWSINTTSIYTGTEDHSGYTANAGDITFYSDGTNASIHAYNFYIDADGKFYSTAGALSGVSITTIPNDTSTDISLLEKTWTMTFSVTNANTIAWTSGTITFSNGRTFSISAGNTGNMAAMTYVYLDPATSTTVLQTTTTAATALAANKALIGTAQNNTVTASWIPYGPGQPLVDGANIGALSITASQIAASTITATKMNVSQLSAIAADIGTITAGNITLNTLGFLRTSGKDNYSDTTAGIFIGYDTDNYKFNVGNANEYIKWSGSALSVAGEFNIDKSFIAGEAITQFDAVSLYGGLFTSASQYITSGAYVDYDKPDTNFQTLTVNQDEGHYKDSLISFTNLTSIIPSGGTAVYIELYLYCTQGDNDKVISIYPLTSSFNHTTVTWNTKPTFHENVLGTIWTPPAGQIPGWSSSSASMSVTSTQWADICDHGIMLRILTGPNTDIIFDDENDENTGYLVVYYKVQDGKIYKANAFTEEFASNFMGIALVAASVSSSVMIRTEGVVTGMSGLTAYSQYYLSDTPGVIDTSVGTITKTVGRALSTTEFQVKYSLGSGI